MNKIIKNTKDYLSKNTWILWLFVFLIIVSFSYDFKTGLLISGLIINGMLAGYIIPICILCLQKRTSYKELLLPILLFAIIFTSIYISIDNKAILIFIIPLAIPNLAAGLLSLKK